MLNLTYPGVYVEPVITPQPPTTGVATSVTAFMGRAPRGPVNQPVLVQSLAEYNRQFDALDVNSTVSYMVSDFYNNGGSQAVVVRLFEPYFETPGALQSAKDVGNTLLESASAETGIAKAVTDVEAAYTTASKSYNQLQKDAGTRFLNSLKAFQKLNPSATNKTNPSVMNGLDAALVVAAPQGKAKVVISLAKTVEGAASQVAQTAYVASLGAPTDKNTVTKAAQTGAGQYSTPAPANDAAQAIVAATQLKQPGSTKLADGTYAAQMAIFQVPTAIDAALNKVIDLSASSDTTVKANYATFRTDLAGLIKLQADSQKTNATYDTVITSAKTNLKDFVSNLEAMPSSTKPFDLAQQATTLVTQELLGLWPDTFTLVAANPGTWGNSLTVTSDVKGITDAVAQSIAPDLTAADLFNLSVSYMTPEGQTMSERFINVTVQPDGGAQRLDHVLQNQSNFLRVPETNEGEPNMPTSPPDASSSGQGSGGTDSIELEMNTYLGDAATKTGLYALDKIKAFNILTIPPDKRQPASSNFNDTPNYVYQTAAQYCSERRAMLLMDPPAQWLSDYKTGAIQNIALDNLGSFGAAEGRSSAIYFPRIIAVDPNLNGHNMAFPASGALAGVWASTDAQSGVWKAPAGLNAALNGIVGPEVVMSDAENGQLNPQGINCLREFNVGGTVAWGARTLRGADQLASEYKYIPVMRTMLYIESSLLQDTQWAVFEVNDETLWARLRLQIGTFMAGLFRQGAFSGSSADKAYYVKCDGTTTTPQDQASGRVNVQVGFAPAYPAEFVVITVSQITRTSN